ncbi:MAG: ABC transporter permease [Lachnospiraceae bacterium]|nr:ABC transporter permease [Lachnospiraceae bacterium]
MSMGKLALQNFKSSFKNYLALILSLGFTVLIFLNFQYLVYSDALTILGQQNAEYSEILVQVVSVVLVCFIFFFLWYSTNVFLTKRKKEIGIYIFMGLTNQKIGRLYMMESMMTGGTALALGIGAGILTTRLFQMILMALSGIAADIQFHFVLQPILITAAVYLAIYFLFVLKGYVSIVRSSVLDMVSANRKNEYVQQKNWILMGKAIAGTGILASGYYMATKDGGQEVMGNVMIAVILVIIGIYLLFDGLLPVLFQKLAKNKRFLYQKERTLWINNVIFRMKKNYRTYAMVCILMLCSVTALATGFAMNERYENIQHFRNTYTYQLLGSQPDLDRQITPLIEKENPIEYSTRAEILMLDSGQDASESYQKIYGLLSYSQIRELAGLANLKCDIEEPADDEVISVSHLYLLSLMTNRNHVNVTLDGKEYHQTAEINEPYLGYLQEDMEYYLVNDRVFQMLLPKGQVLYTYNYRITDPLNYKASLDELDALTNGNPDVYTGRIAIDPENKGDEWIKVAYSVCVFMFLVFVMASGSILFMKLYNDAFEEKERYGVLQKLGYQRNKLRKAISRELAFAYVLPFAIMTLSSYFSIHALEKMMNTSLLILNMVSVAIILLFFLLCYLLSVSMYQKNAGLKKSS